MNRCGRAVAAAVALLVVGAVPAIADAQHGASAGGTLRVRIAGMPSGVTADVRVVGPIGTQTARWRLAETAVLRGMPPGIYRLVARPVLVGADDTWTAIPTQRRVVVRSGKSTRAIVTYTPDIPIRGASWGRWQD